MWRHKTRKYFRKLGFLMDILLNLLLVIQVEDTKIIGVDLFEGYE